MIDYIIINVFFFNFFMYLGHSGLINAISFAGNGNYLATSANDFGIHLWDLRKFQVFETLYLHKEYKIMDLCFDNSGTYLGVAGSDIRLNIFKQYLPGKTNNKITLYYFYFSVFIMGE